MRVTFLPTATRAWARCHHPADLTDRDANRGIFMASADSFGAKGTLDVNGKSYEIYRLNAVEGDGIDVESLPFSLKVLLENLLRTEDGADITADDIRALAAWDPEAEPDKEI